MHVAILTDSESQGGAAILANRVAEGLIAAGCKATRVVARPDGLTHSWDTRTLFAGTAQHLLWMSAQAKLRRASLASAQLLERLWVQRSLRAILADVKPDVINVHNIHGANLSPGMVGVCADCAPTAWSIHDMWSFTGRCAYSRECRKFLTGCDTNCPTASEYPPLPPRAIGKSWRARERLLAGHPGLTAITASRWMTREAGAGLWRHHRLEEIPYGLDLEVYRPLKRTVAREVLGIEACGPVLLMCAEDIGERRKGGDLLVGALRKLKDHSLTILTVGQGALPLESDAVRIHPLGFVDHERTSALAYSAADALVHPAPADNMPLVVMESLACGTPVVGFPIGGVVDMVRPGETGWLADSVSVDSLASAMESAIADVRSGVDRRESCRSIAESDYGAELFTQRYLSLFRSLVESG